MTAINRGSCFFCGEVAGAEDCDEIGHNQVWVCGRSECNRELAAEQRGAYDNQFLDACEDNFDRY